MNINLKGRSIVWIGWVLATTAFAGTPPLTESKFTQVVNEVKVVSMPAKQITSARVENWVKSPDRIRTGADSMAELEAQDKTVTRIGANTVFSFGPDRAMNLERGSILFHTPKGKGGGKIQTGGASASVLGTTIIVTATDDGGFKTIVLEGKAEMRLPNGDFRVIKAGQLAFVLPGSQKFGPVLTINLGKLAVGSGLVNGFERRLSSLDRIEGAMIEQSKSIENGHAVDTGMLVGRRATEDAVEVVDASILERIVAKRAAAKDPAQEDAVVSGDALPETHLSEIDKSQIPDSTDTGPAGALVARNLRIKNSTIDLTPHMQGAGNEFAFYASEELSVEGSVDFVGNNRPGFELFLGGEKRLKIKSRARVTATGVGNLNLRSGGEFELRKVGIINNSGDVELAARRNLKYDDSTVSGTDSIRSHGAEQEIKKSDLVALSGGVEVSATDNDLVVDSSSLIGATQTSLYSKSDTDVNNGSRLTANMILVDAGRDLRVQNTTVTGGTLAMQAGEQLTWENVSLVGLSAISLAARTLVLEDVAFPSGSTVELRSELGLLAPKPNTGRAPVSGHVNFIRNVTYGGDPAQNAVGGAIKLSPR